MSQTLSRFVVGQAGHQDLTLDGGDETAPSLMDRLADPIRAGLLFEPTVDVSIVLPYFNPGDRLRPTVERVLRVLGATGTTFEVIAVSDGSTDGSQSTLDGLPEHLVRQVSYPVNAGKGHAIRVGFEMARGDLVGFIDADGDIPPEFIAEFVRKMRRDRLDIVIGSKRHHESVVKNRLFRRLYSWSYQSLVRVLFSLGVKDTQVGIKLVDRRVVDEVVPLMRENRFAFDVELLVLAKHHGFTRIAEAPVRIEDRAGSTISFRAIRRLLFDTLAIFWRSSVRHDYQLEAFAQPRKRSGAAVSVVEPLPSPMAL